MYYLKNSFTRVSLQIIVLVTRLYTKKTPEIAG